LFCSRAAVGAAGRESEAHGESLAAELNGKSADFPPALSVTVSSLAYWL
jgi:hypothetical protein